jgi:hypothetical protein
MKSPSLLKFRVILVLFTILIFQQAGLDMAEAGYVRFPVPEAKETVAARIASDGNRLLTFYAYLDPQVDSSHPTYKYGKIKEWKDGGWQNLGADAGGFTNLWFFDHFISGNLDLAVQGDNIIYVWQGSDGTRIASCYNGTWSGTIANEFYAPNYPRAAFAFGLPYYNYTCMTQGGTREVWAKTWPIFYQVPAVNGAYRYFGPLIDGSVMMSALTGTGTKMYVAFASYFGPTQQQDPGCISVLQVDSTGNQYVGDPIPGVHPRNPEIIMNGRYRITYDLPIIAWLEDNYLRIYMWTFRIPELGWRWYSQYIEEFPLNTVGRLSMVAASDKFYVAYQYKEGTADTVIRVLEFGDMGGHLSTQNIPLNSSNPASVIFQGLAFYKGNLVAAYLDNKALKIIQLKIGGVNIAPIVPLLLK